MSDKPEELSPELLALEQALMPSALVEIDDPFLYNHHIQLWIKRDDLLHPIISGNKWRKLKYNLDEVLKSGADSIISMGGAFSNYLHALAYASKQLGLYSAGIIRGERPAVLGPTLRDLDGWGMELRFVSRADYRQYRNYLHSWDVPDIKVNQYWLPEGGSAFQAQRGMMELAEEIDIAYDVLCVPCGTGATLAGLINACPDNAMVMGFSALKNADYLDNEIRAQLRRNNSNWLLNKAYHFGGFAKINPTLTLFMRDFEANTSIPLEPIYTAKMLYGIYDLIAKNYFKPGSRIVAVHTGGLQGRRGFSL